ncbi:hypothetical protein MTR67_044853 [Solanum verrucosum]|uniref:Uncharacterized protein n=1 Tax=Solanum verrucosum TaxID=315347 RepID=A0AAF0ZVN0_SOLVR|nr:hypothetical protein MTR67_044853 [Solanum verrucosum]
MALERLFQGLSNNIWKYN